MASYGKFQSDNKKYGLNNRDNYNPEFNPTVSAKSEKQKLHLIKIFING